MVASNELPHEFPQEQMCTTRRAFLRPFPSHERVCVLPEGLSEGSHNANLVSHHRVGILTPIVPSNVFCVATTPDSVLWNLYDLPPLPRHLNFKYRSIF